MPPPKHHVLLQSAEIPVARVRVPAARRLALRERVPDRPHDAHGLGHGLDDGLTVAALVCGLTDQDGRAECDADEGAGHEPDRPYRHVTGSTAAGSNRR